MWDPPRPGLEPVSPTLAGRFSTTAPPGKPWEFFIHSGYKSFSDIWFASIFFQSDSCILFLLRTFFKGRNCQFINVFLFRIMLLSPRNLCFTQSHRNFLQPLLLEVFEFKVLHFRVVYNLRWVNLCVCGEGWIEVNCLHIDIHLFHHHLLKRLFLSLLNYSCTIFKDEMYIYHKMYFMYIILCIY